ncbi:baseplate J/gp47 family protein [Gorillibacterium timonense]|uniref:baseplate J/gp47 family protein n=1 Tax=Gorillibacterium timonense TaxID=1689269 RepID=UPI00071DFFC7|nr:baseplate J/gp47 family protein [Gorillibacterium timonense]
MYEDQTKALILQRMLTATPDDLDKRQGSVTFDLLSPAAIELAQAYTQLDHVLTFGFVGPKQPSEYLELRANELGLLRRPSVKAEGEVTFSGDNDTGIPVGTAVSTDEEDALVFLTVEEGVIKQGTARVKAIAAVGGIAGNVAKNRIKLVLGDKSGIVSVTNTKPFLNGADTESDESLIGRYLDRVRRPATSGNAWHYRQWALEVPGVGDVKVFPVWNGNGTVKLAVLSDDKRAPGSPIIDRVKKAVEERRPVGALVTVSPAVEVGIAVSARLTLAADAQLDEVSALFQTALTVYLADLAFQDPIVRYNRILGLLLDIVSIVDFDDLTINGVQGNLELVDDQVAVAGAVNFVVA